MNQKIMNKCCINCRSFAWWDGDFCCVNHMKILQHADNGYFINEDILKTIKDPLSCPDYEYEENDDIREMYESEFKKFIEFKKMQDEYYNYTHDLSNIKMKK